MTGSQGTEWFNSGRGIPADDGGYRKPDPPVQPDCCCPDCESYCPVHQSEMYAKTHPAQPDKTAEEWRPWFDTLEGPGRERHDGNYGNYEYQGADAAYLNALEARVELEVQRRGEWQRMFEEERFRHEQTQAELAVERNRAERLSEMARTASKAAEVDWQARIRADADAYETVQSAQAEFAALRDRAERAEREAAEWRELAEPAVLRAALEAAERRFVEMQQTEGDREHLRDIASWGMSEVRAALEQGDTPK